MQLWNGDCLDLMKDIDEEFIDLTVTSPPYDNIRSYNGSLTDWNEAKWKAIIAELYRVTKNGGVVVWVVGDATEKFKESLSSFRQALFFTECGFGLLDTMIYYKENYAPAYPALRRYANQFEYMFIFSKGRPKTFNPVQHPKVRNKEEKVAYRMRDGSLKRKTKPRGRETKDASNVWHFAVGGNATGHPAVFPEALARNHIISWSNEGDTVFDPFMGSGTTGKMALLNGRKFIGIEREESYFNIAKQRIEGTLL